MSNSNVNGKPGVSVSALCLLAIVGMACKLSSLPGAKMNMFEGSNAQDGATKIKAKLGVERKQAAIFGGDERIDLGE